VKVCAEVAFAMSVEGTHSHSISVLNRLWTPKHEREDVVTRQLKFDEAKHHARSVMAEGPSGPGPVLLLADVTPLTRTVVQTVLKGPRGTAPVRREHNILRALAAAVRLKKNVGGATTTVTADGRGGGGGGGTSEDGTATATNATATAAATTAATLTRDTIRVAYIGTLSGDTSSSTNTNETNTRTTGPYAEFAAACDARLGLRDTSDGYVLKPVNAYMRSLDADDRAWLAEVGGPVQQ
jgi:hypothetical protein